MRRLDLDFVVECAFAPGVVGEELEHVALGLACLYCKAHNAFRNVVDQAQSAVEIVVGQLRCVLGNHVSCVAD